MIRRPPRSTQSRSSAASDVYKRQMLECAGPSHRLRPSVLAVGLAQSTGGMTATLRRLESEGLIERVPDPADVRATFAVLTPRGRRTGLASYDAMARRYEELLDDWGPAGRKSLVEMLRRLLDTLEPAGGFGDSSRGRG